MTTVPLPLPKSTAAAASPTAAPVSPARAAVSRAPADASRAPRDWTATGWRAVTGIVLTMSVVVALIGFAGSYSSLSELAESKGFGRFSWVFPIGVDAGIIATLAMDLILARRGLSWPLLRPTGHGLTLATIYFNANAGTRSPAEDPVAAGMHAVLPLLFVIFIEGGRYMILRTTGIEHGHRPDGIPVHRWFLSPWRTWGMYRRMRLWGITSYPEVVALEQERSVYKTLLIKRYGSLDKVPPADQDVLLPLTMAKYGLTVDQALALPLEAAEREQRRLEAEEVRKVEEAGRAAERRAELQAIQLRAAGSVDAVKHEVQASTDAAQARAHATVTAAERSAALETEALESETAAEARRRAAAADLAAERDRQAARETELAARETERAARETEAATREAERREAEERARIAAAEEREEVSRLNAAEAARGVAEIRLATAEMELRAAEAEDLAGLTPRERAIRKLARIVLADHGGNVERMPLETVMEVFNVANGTASQYRQAAAQLIADGYRLESAGVHA